MAKDLKGKYTPEELQAMMDDPSHYEKLDRIEKLKITLDKLSTPVYNL